MKRIFYIVAISIVFVACDRDDSKISLSPDGVQTLDVTNITSTSAKISGYFNFYKIVGDVFADDYDNIDIDESASYQEVDTYYISKDSLDYYLADVLGFRKTIDYNIPADCPDSVLFEVSTADVDYYGTALVYDTRRDFYNMEYVVVTTARKAGSFSVTLRNLTPNTTYYYKTAVLLEPVMFLTCREIGMIQKRFAEFTEDNMYDIYGDTKEFKTLP